MKKITLLMIYLLFIWFTLDITGLKIGSSLIVSSAFKDEPIDLIFWIIFLICILFFIFKDRMGRFLLGIFILFWTIIQFSMYFSFDVKAIKKYNIFFNNTYRFFPFSEKFLIKDAYHIILDILILCTLISLIIFILSDYIDGKKYNNLFMKSIDKS
ncbi:hypothetical protein [Streptococcus massiliensis]|uniref:Uncharacterized protein n=1 Tax=Streptococcus massiliensis TaxID=313439 RepID=A0A380KY32_9STRE|nr:hypothetical protein [Streptococcus massiliensis]SUN76618.1 Uncharacterised protein [Streptococcus massiliensis]